ncbi:MAG: hypothetical protein EOP83_08425 [Verrucomicrobiaceae bacterium]|nr:MAG: hypothetical protein EOP83_08425 [Verrucomicrobiaceae bacterium]
MHWFRAITKDEKNLTPVAEALEYFQVEYEEGQAELKVKGRRIDDVACKLPGIMEYRFAQYQELETILQYLEKVETKALIEQTQWFMANYPRQIPEHTARKYAEVEPNVFALTKIKLEVATVRNNFLALFKGIEALHYQVRNIVMLRTAGFDDATF